MEGRRVTDVDQTHEIEKMIGEEQDPRVRVQLLMMNRLTTAVAAISVTVSDLDKKVTEQNRAFAKHASGEEALLNQVRGGWKVAAWVFSIAQAAVVYVYLDLHSDVQELAAAQKEDSIAHVRMDGRLSLLELRKSLEEKESRK